jgi:hypothetical protein
VQVRAGAGATAASFFGILKTRISKKKSTQLQDKRTRDPAHANIKY